ncbi:hypothetical protein CJK01_22700 [Salmonella enterica subsp. enterica serovar Newport]|nr:hypothetical protein [Salmonella enterica subsp. enterica serovar Newport]
MPVVFSNSFHCQSFGTERANQQSLQSTDRAPLLITCCLRDPRLYGLNVSVSSFPVNGMPSGTVDGRSYAIRRNFLTCHP